LASPVLKKRFILSYQWLN